VRIAAFGLLAVVSVVFAEPGVIIESDNDTVVKIEYLGSANDNAPILSVSGVKRYGAKIEGNWRAAVGKYPGFKEPYPGLPVGVAGAGPIGVAALGSGTSNPVIGVHAMSESANSSGYNYGIEVKSIGGMHNYAIRAQASSGTNNYAAYFVGNIAVSGGVCTPCTLSDEKYKKNIVDLEGGLNKVLALRPKSYEMRVAEFQDNISLQSGVQDGFIAHELQKVIPNAVHSIVAPPDLSLEEIRKGTHKEGVSYLGVNYTSLIPVIVKAMQEQQARIEALEAQLREK
jgi:hypothetical protein